MNQDKMSDSMTFPRGEIGAVCSDFIKGWVSGGPKSNDALTVTLCIDGKKVASKPANEWRPVLARGQWHGNGMCGFYFSKAEYQNFVTPSYSHKVQVFAETRSGRQFELKNSPAVLSLELGLAPTAEAVQPNNQASDRTAPTRIVNAPNYQTARKTVVVIGVSRGGTSMCAGLTRLLGVHFGDNAAPDSQEVAQFHTDSKRHLVNRIVENNSKHQLWGWKHTGDLRLINRVKKSLINPHFIVVLRDPLATAQAFHRHHGTDLQHALKEVQKRNSAIFRFVSAETSPMMLVSYEKCLSYREKAVAEFAQFLDLPASQSECHAFSRYISTDGYQKFGQFVSQLPQELRRPSVDSRMSFKGRASLASSRVEGWAIGMNESEPLQVDLLVNQELAQSALANLMRHDLQRNGMHESGECGFSFELDQQTLADRSVLSIKEHDSQQHLSGSPIVWRTADTPSATSHKRFAFIHIPKTCGTSFRIAMQRQFGLAVVNDYTDKSNDTCPIPRATLYDRARGSLVDALIANDTIMYGGHFTYQDYHQLLETYTDHWISFVRSPVERYLSSFNHRVQRYGLEMSLEEYLENPLLHNEQSAYLRGIPISKLSYIGISEYYELSLKLFAATHGITLEYLEENRALKDKGGVSTVPDKVRKQIEKKNQLDIKLYQDACSEFSRRLRQHNLPVPHELENLD